MWAGAIALILILAADLILAFFDIRERREARQERAELRKEREEMRAERRYAEIERQRSEVTCTHVGFYERAKTDNDLCAELWAQNSKLPGFAVEKHLFQKLPEYLMKKCDRFLTEIGRSTTSETTKVYRPLIVFTFPYPDFDAVLDDIRRRNFGDEHFVWDVNGKRIKVRRD